MQGRVVKVFRGEGAAHHRVFIQLKNKSVWRYRRPVTDAGIARFECRINTHEGLYRISSKDWQKVR